MLELLRSYIFWRSTVDAFHGPVPQKFSVITVPAYITDLQYITLLYITF